MTISALLVAPTVASAQWVPGIPSYATLDPSLPPPPRIPQAPPQVHTVPPPADAPDAWPPSPNWQLTPGEDGTSDAAGDDVTQGIVGNDDSAPAGPGVARISILRGAASLQRGGSQDGEPVSMNSPIVAGDYLTTSESGRAEIQFDAVSMLRLGSNAQVHFKRVDPAHHDVEIEIAAGTAQIATLRPDEEPQVDTPSIAVRPNGVSDIRISVNDDATAVTVRRGTASITGDEDSQTVATGKTLVAWGAADHPRFSTKNAIAQDDFDKFNISRDKQLIAALADPHLNSAIDGYEDLSANGRWRDDTAYGEVWQPNVGSGWAPYRDGRWTWTPGAGWTWVAAEPWGWGPYHYGRWARTRQYGWVWSPPARTSAYHPAAPVWRPALVGFVPAKSDASRIGWVPLAPHEAYRPTQTMNAASTTPRYRNLAYHDALSTADAKALTKPKITFARTTTARSFGNTADAWKHFTALRSHVTARADSHSDGYPTVGGDAGPAANPVQHLDGPSKPA